MSQTEMEHKWSTTLLPHAFLVQNCSTLFGMPGSTPYTTKARMRTQKLHVSSDRAAKDAEETTTAAAQRLPLQTCTSLAALSGEKPRTKAGQVQWLWPQIKSALRDGHKIRHIWECLVEDGLELSYSRLRWYVARLRRMEAAGTDLPKNDLDQNKFPANPGQNLAAIRRDPLANLKTHLNKRPGFEFDERPPDEKKLF